MTTLKKIFTMKNMMIAVAVLVTVALVTTSIVISTKKGTPAKGNITNEDFFEEIPVRYSPETRTLFTNNLRKYLSLFFGFEIESARILADPLMNYLMSAEITAEKAIDLTEYLISSVSPDGENKGEVDGFGSVILFFCDLEFDEQTGTLKKVTWAPENHILDIFTKINYGAVVQDIIENTALTSTDMGKLIFALMGSEDNSEEESKFVSLFIEAVTGLQLVGEFFTTGGSTWEARYVGEMIYELGIGLKMLIDSDNGIKNVLSALGLDREIIIPDGYEDMKDQIGVDVVALLGGLDAINGLIKDIRDVTEFAVYFLSEMAVNIENKAFEAISWATDENTANPMAHRAYSMISLARSAKQGLEYAFSKSTTIKNTDTLTAKLVSFRLQLENLNGGIPADKFLEREQEITEETANYIAHTLAVANDYKDIKDTDGVLLLTSDKINDLKAHLAFYDETNIDLKGTASVYALTWIITAYVRIAEELNITEELFPTI